MGVCEKIMHDIRSNVHVVIEGGRCNTAYISNTEFHRGGIVKLLDELTPMGGKSWGTTSKKLVRRQRRRQCCYMPAKSTNIHLYYSHSTNDIRHHILPLSTPSLVLLSSAPTDYDTTITGYSNAASNIIAPFSISTGNHHVLDTIIFVVGIVPFLWATNEFWRRIAVGEPFGTGQNSVVISLEHQDEKGEINDEREERIRKSRRRQRSKRTLGKGALIVAYMLFSIASFSVLIALAGILIAPPSY